MPLQKDGLRRVLSDSLQARAKINIHLEVLNRRDDGYHNIFSVMAGVALHDLLKLEEISVGGTARDGLRVKVLNAGGQHAEITESIPLNENLVAKAAALYFELMGSGGAVTFSLVKNIPAGAGLGGGSSDAAATLKLLNARLSAFRDDELAAMAARIGADVPYCLQGGFAACRGIGDIVTPVPGKKGASVLIVNQGVHINTASAYRALGRGTESDPAREAKIGKRTRAIVSALSRGAAGELKATAINDFEEPVFRLHPEIAKMKETLYGLKADFAIMTGSGSSIIALFRDVEGAREARSRLRESQAEVILTKFA